jgi:Zinc carboxypeptidase
MRGVGWPSRTRIAVALVAVTASVALAVPSAGAGGCGPGYDPSITPPTEAISGYPVKEATTQELLEYFATVDGESDRVTTGTYATSWMGTPLIYALVTDESQLPAVDEIAARQRALRDPRVTSADEAAEIAETNPGIVWYSANVHGNEESGADASAQILYELAAGTDCGTQKMLDNLVIGIIPTQNPDGRDLNTRQNAYGFDMNRDWFARTQPEIDGQLDLLRRYPPLLFMDVHETGGRQYFFPPNADPVHHEISQQSLAWIYKLYGRELEDEFYERQQQQPEEWNYYHYDPYDFFAMIYGDTVPTTAHAAAGMTFEKGNGDPFRQRWLEQWVAGWTCLKAAADNRKDILLDHYQAWVDALEEGRNGVLEPNRTYEPGEDLDQQVPDLRIRHYFLPPETDRAHPDTARLIERLLDTEVEVYRLTADLTVPDLQFYGRVAEPGVVPAGSYWIPMDQPQKHWIQALLGEDPYVAVFSFYAISAWSNPLLMNLDASFSGTELDPQAHRVVEAPVGEVAGDPNAATHFWFPGDSGRSVAAAWALARDGLEVERLAEPSGGLPDGAFVIPAEGDPSAALAEAAERFVVRIVAREGEVPDGFPFDQPTIGVYDRPGRSEESFRHLRYVLEQVWRVPYTGLTGEEVKQGALEAGNYDVFVVPGVTTRGLGGAVGAIRTWVEAGGTYVGTGRASFGGTHYAVRNGLTSSKLHYEPGVSIPGTLFRFELRDSSPVTLGAPEFAYANHRGEQILSPSVTGANPGLFPESEPAFWYSGWARGGGALKGTAEIVDETLGAGHVVLFAGEPHHRAYVEGTMSLLANALAYPQGMPGAGVDVGSAAAEESVRAAMASAGPEVPGRAFRLEVSEHDVDAVMRVVSRFTSRATVEHASGSAFVLVPNPEDLEVDEHPFATEMMVGLREAGIELLSAVL